MSKKKRYEYSERSVNEDFYERQAKKKAMRDDHKDRWKFNPSDYEEPEEDFEERRVSY